MLQYSLALRAGQDNSDERTFLVCRPWFPLVQVDHRFYVETGIDQRDVTSDSYVAMLWRWRRQLPIEIRRRWMHFLAEIPDERSALTKAGFLVSGQAVLIPKARRRVRLMLIVPIMGHLLIMLAELYVVLVLSLAAILRNRNRCVRQNQPCEYTKMLFH